MVVTKHSIHSSFLNIMHPETSFYFSGFKTTLLLLHRYQWELTLIEDAYRDGVMILGKNKVSETTFKTEIIDTHRLYEDRSARAQLTIGNHKLFLAWNIISFKQNATLLFNEEVCKAYEVLPGIAKRPIYEVQSINDFFIYDDTYGKVAEELIIDPKDVSKALETIRNIQSEEVLNRLKSNKERVQPISLTAKLFTLESSDY